MIEDSIIFIEEPYVETSHRYVLWKCILEYLLMCPHQLIHRVLSSFIPPIFGPDSRRVYVDFIGPGLAFIILGFILQCGHANKHSSAVLTSSPLLILLYYALIMPSLCVFMARMGRANLTSLQVLALVGYGLYGHIFTLLASVLIKPEASNAVFFFAMCVFGGLSCFRILIVFLLTIPRPAARLLVCSFVSTFQILFLIFIHFAYMHRTFVYGKKL